MLLLWCGAQGHDLSEIFQGLAGFQEVSVEFTAPLQYFRQLLQHGLHVMTVVLIDREHLFLHLLAKLCHLQGD